MRLRRFLSLLTILGVLLTGSAAGADYINFAPNESAAEGGLKAAVGYAGIPSAPKIYKGDRISLEFQNAEIQNIIRIIGEVSGRNVVISDEVRGKVTLKLRDVPWDQALDIVLSTKGLAAEESGNVLTVYDLATYRKLKDNRKADRADQADYMQNRPLVKKVFTPKYAALSAVLAEMEKAKSDRGRITAIGNDIYVQEDPAAMVTLTQAFLRVDQVARQILIEARIIEASSRFAQNLGIQWGGAYNNQGIASAANNLVPNTTAGFVDINGGATLGFGFLNRANTLLLNATINANEHANEAKTISAPRIMAANDQEVYIKQGHQIPYLSGATPTTPSNTEFKEAVMELRVIPHIEDNGQIVTMDIKLTNDSPYLLDKPKRVSTTFGGAVANSPEWAISTRMAKTKLMVRDGETVVIGGIIVDSQSTGSDRVPGLHRIPLLGWLFQNRAIDNLKSELLIFITANIMPINI